FDGLRSSPDAPCFPTRRSSDLRGTEGVFDSLADIRAATQGLDGTSPLRFARALALRRGDPAGLRYLDAVRRLQPEEPFWTASTADRKSTRLNSSHDQISYAVFC